MYSREVGQYYCAPSRIYHVNYFSRLWRARRYLVAVLDVAQHSFVANGYVRIVDFPTHPECATYYVTVVFVSAVAYIAAFRMRRTCCGVSILGVLHLRGPSHS